ncbi:hypothetical protein BKA83DRAFT_4023215, partial [Pisolithus microcarpus]
ASLCVYSPYDDIALPNNTVAFVIAKVSIPVLVCEQPVLLEVVHVVAVPDDPAEDSFWLHVPGFPYPVMI